MTKHPWSPTELALLRRLYPRSTGAAIATRLGRSLKSVYNAVNLYGLKKQRRTSPDPARVRTLNALGWSDNDIARSFPCERHTVSRLRKSLGLPSNARGERYRDRVIENTRKQCQQAGVASLAELRSVRLLHWSETRGWGAIPPREAMILDALESLGPLTRRQITEAIGMDWHGSRSSLKAGNRWDSRGSHLANLMARGSVVCLGRLNKGRGRGHSTCVYTLSATAVREVL